jgi:two-component system copper resistance phosphate regulon response regulator CusR
VERPDKLVVADLQVDLVSQQVRRGEHRIELTAKEYALLVCLMGTPGSVMSRSMIIDNVWDQSFEGVSSIVDVYVRYLRRKIDDPFTKKLIHTVRGVGYCIRAPELQ